MLRFWVEETLWWDDLTERFCSLSDESAPGCEPFFLLHQHAKSKPTAMLSMKYVQFDSNIHAYSKCSWMQTLIYITRTCLWINILCCWTTWNNILVNQTELKTYTQIKVHWLMEIYHHVNGIRNAKSCKFNPYVYVCVCVCVCVCNIYFIHHFSFIYLDLHRPVELSVAVCCYCSVWNLLQAVFTNATAEIQHQKGHVV